MKKLVLASAMMLTAVVSLAKDIKTVVVTTDPQMHCENCENKIKGNLRFEKGVKTIDCNISEQRVTITYDAEKTKTFVYNYTQRYGVQPSLESFSFQGYDITCYFVELVLNHFDHDRVKVSPIAFPLSFDKSPDGGYENVNVQFLEIKDDEIVPSLY